MKILVKKNKTLISKIQSYTPFWTNNVKFWPELSQAISPNKNPSSLHLDGNIIAISKDGLSFIAELPARKRVIEISDENARRTSRREEKKYVNIYMPKMIIASKYYATLKLQYNYAFYLEKDLDPTDTEYINQRLYLTGLLNQYPDGYFCNPDVRYPTSSSINTLLNHSYSCIFGSSFNTDLVSIPNGISDEIFKDLNLYDIYKIWENLTDEEVLALKWRRAGTPNILALMDTLRIDFGINSEDNIVYEEEENFYLKEKRIIALGHQSNRKVYF